MSTYMYMSAGSRNRRNVSLSLQTLGFGFVAVVAFSMALTTMLFSTDSVESQNKFVTSRDLGTSRGVRQRVNSMKMDFGEDAGILPPVGYLDPLKFGEKADADRLRWFREAEIKHGRIAMLAAVGFLVGENPQLHDVFFPGEGSELSVNALSEGPHHGFWHLLVAFVGFHEFGFYKNFENGGPDLGINVADNIKDKPTIEGTGKWYWTLKKDRIPGDLGFDPLNLKPKDAKAFTNKRNKELQNGRLAMLAIAGMNAQELTDGKPIWPIHGIGAASAEEVQALGHNLNDGLELVKEMAQVLADTA